MKREFILDLGKLVIAAAWADGELTHHEINALKDLLFQLPEVSGEEWTALEMYMEAPVNAAEREKLLARVLDHVGSRKERDLVLNVLRELAEADGEVSDEERRLLERVEAALNEKDAGLLSRLGSLMSDLVGRRQNRYAGGAAREDDIEDYIRNRVYFRLTEALEEKGEAINLPEREVRKLCLAAGLMANVAGVDEVSGRERNFIRQTLIDDWNLPEREAGLVADIAASEDVRGLDRMRLAWRFYDFTTLEEREQFVACLFKLANSCSQTSYDEIERIRQISMGLKVPHAEFIAAKLSIPRKDRGGF